METGRLDWTDVDEPTPWAKASIALMKRIASIGWTAAVEAEMDAPTITDPDWLKTVIAFASGVAPPKPENEYIFGLYRCPTCKDRLYVPGDAVRRSGRIYTTVVPCTGRRCPAWTEARREAAEERTKRDRSRGRVKKPDDVQV